MRAKLPLTTGTVDRDGVQLHYEIYGEGDHTIVFVPTWAIIHSRCWKAQVPYFSDFCRVITYDPRGNGKSGRPATPEGYTLDKIVDDVFAILDETETEKAILVGLSLSSGVVFAAAERHPERVEGIVSIGAWTPIVPRLPGRDGDPNLPASADPKGWDKYNYDYWRRDYADFTDFFLAKVNSEPHSTKQHEDAVRWAADGDAEMLHMTDMAESPGPFLPKPAINRSVVRCLSSTPRTTRSRRSKAPRRLPS
ncbi:MAG: alpha/beta hydrolase [Paracoccaceae bacterium]|nr:alpha/beta hydrolase [Paracoccaceae bacterium]